jgi:uncharacterized small protein (DUF1192 family)
MLIERVRKLSYLRHNHGAWLLLTSRRAPLVVGCFEVLFDEQSEVLFEDVVQKLGETFTEFSNTEDFEIRDNDVFGLARKEVREWIKKKLVVERDGLLYSTDALQRAMRFLETLEDQGMTSTASRLAVVQREIDLLEAQLNPKKASRIELIKKKMAELEEELVAVEAGEFEPLSGARAREGIREVYQLGMSLKLDFRRVEDSYREADKKLRQEITRSDQDRGSVLDSLLESHETLLNTPEGQVFDGFYEQLQQPLSLDEMKLKLKSILERSSAKSALNYKERSDLQWLVSGLVYESQRVIEARSRGEKDVKSYVKTGLASENFRVGVLINELLDAAVDIDWKLTKTCKMRAMLPPVGMAVANLPLVQRLMFKELIDDDGGALDLTESSGQVGDLGEDFWVSFNSLNRHELYEKTMTELRKSGVAMKLSELVHLFDAEHDLETVTYWLTLAREAGIEFSEERERLLVRHEAGAVEFDVPLLQLAHGELAEVDIENLG